MNVSQLSERIRASASSYGARVIAVYLFGSRVRGEVGPLSDLDLAVLFHPRERLHFLDLRCALYADFSRALQTNAIDLTVLNTLENMFVVEEVIRNGIVLYDNHTDLRHEFEVNAQHRVIDFKEQRLRITGV